jgi:hypothetical protein
VSTLGPGKDIRMRGAPVALSIAVLTLTSGFAATDSRAANGRLSCTAFAVSTGGPVSSPVATQVDIVVERWSADAERRRLIEAMKESQGAMLETLRDLRRVGSIRTPGNLGWDLHYAHETPGEDGGRHIVIATDRPMPIWEVANRPRTVDYPFTFIEMRLRDGEGEGKLSLATQVISSRDGRFVQLENYDTQPVQLNRISCK